MLTEGTYRDDLLDLTILFILSYQEIASRDNQL